MLLALLLLTANPTLPIAEETVDLIHVNHFHDAERGTLVFDQVIFLDWDCATSS